MPSTTITYLFYEIQGLVTSGSSAYDAMNTMENRKKPTGR